MPALGVGLTLGWLRRHPWQADGLLARLLVAGAYTWMIWMRQRL